MISKALYQEQFPRSKIQEKIPKDEDEVRLLRKGFEDTIAALKNFVELLKQIIRQHNLQDETLANAVGKLETKIPKLTPPPTRTQTTTANAEPSA